MCGAYGLSVRNIQNLTDKFYIVNALDNFKPRWNIRPGQSNPVIVSQGNKEIELMVWGYYFTLPLMININTKQ